MQLSSQGKDALINFLKQQFPESKFRWDVRTGQDKEFSFQKIKVMAHDGVVHCDAVFYYLDEVPNFYYASILNTPDGEEEQG